MQRLSFECETKLIILSIFWGSDLNHHNLNTNHLLCVLPGDRLSSLGDGSLSIVDGRFPPTIIPVYSTPYIQIKPMKGKHQKDIVENNKMFK